MWPTITCQKMCWVSHVLVQEWLSFNAQRADSVLCKLCQMDLSMFSLPMHLVDWQGSICCSWQTQINEHHLKQSSQEMFCAGADVFVTSPHLVVRVLSAWVFCMENLWIALPFAWDAPLLGIGPIWPEPGISCCTARGITEKIGITLMCNRNRSQYIVWLDKDWILPAFPNSHLVSLCLLSSSL